jgi:cell division protease FtsH
MYLSTFFFIFPSLVIPFRSPFLRNSYLDRRRIQTTYSSPKGNYFPASNYQRYLKARYSNQTDDSDMDEGTQMIANILKQFNDSIETNYTIIGKKFRPKGQPVMIIRRIPSPIMEEEMENDLNPYDDERDNENPFRRMSPQKKKNKSEHFEIVSQTDITFENVGGYDNIKQEMNQCIDILSNYTKYIPFNVRVPKGLIFEGPPGNGKTLLAKAFSGEANASFIAVSGSEFQDKYVGVGASKVRELFDLARTNIPCIIFIDEIDAVGRKRSSEGELSTSERDSTLNELLIALDGFKNISGVFIIGATNRADLLDPALLRPGRIDKRIFIDNPDEKTRKAIIAIHSKGKPFDSSVRLDDLVEQTNGFSGAQIENLLNEAMLYALRQNRAEFTSADLDIVMNKIMAGWQPNEHAFTSDLVHQIAIHELGHAVVSLFCKHHPKMKKIIIHLSSPKTPAYTLFEKTNSSTIMTREALFEHLIILLGGRIAEEVFFGVSVTTGAVHDFEEVMRIAQNMICYYGMGEKLIYPNTSEKYKEIIDNEIAELIQKAYSVGLDIIHNSKSLIHDGAILLEQNKLVTYEELLKMSEK